ncbi:MAG: helix-turn-helix transcriptional regulator [Chlamydiota bacterium]
MSQIFMTPMETAKHIATSARTRRLALNLSQQSLSERSGVSLSVIKKFERTGKISLESLLKLALALNGLDDFIKTFSKPIPEELPALDDLLKQTTRKRGRK